MRTTAPAPARWTAQSRSIKWNSYLDTYDGKFLPGSEVGGKSLLGPRTNPGARRALPGCRIGADGRDRTSIAHCPISQLFLGSGTMPWKRTVDSGVNIAAGTDFGGGDEWLIPRVLGDAFKVHMNEAGEA